MGRGSLTVTLTLTAGGRRSTSGEGGHRMGKFALHRTFPHGDSGLLLGCRLFLAVLDPPCGAQRSVWARVSHSLCSDCVISLFSSLKWDDTHYTGSETPNKTEAPSLSSLVLCYEP